MNSDKKIEYGCFIEDKLDFEIIHKSYNSTKIYLFL